MTVEELLAYPWTWQGPFRVVDGGQQHWEMRVAELPGFFVAGETGDDVRREAIEALRAYLESFLESGDQLPFTSAWSNDLQAREGPIAGNQGPARQVPDDGYAYA